jgi:CheY-like chemotaxis protein
MNSQTILIIEDNEQNLYLMRFLLEKNGFQVVEARSGREGLEVAKSVDPDLILLDIQLPHMDGYAVAQALRKQERQRSTPSWSSPRMLWSATGRRLSPAARPATSRSPSTPISSSSNFASTCPARQRGRPGARR